MPSGITAEIYEGKDVTLRDYLMTVGRQMGFAIMQREEGLGEPVKYVEPSRYHERVIAEKEARLQELRAMTPGQVAKAAREAFEKAHAEWVEARNEERALRERYETMLRQVEAWEPDELIASTKESAIKYLRESIGFDCGPSYLTEPVEQAPDEWIADQLAVTQRSLASSRKHMQEEIDRTAERNRYIDAFYASLPKSEVSVS